MLQNHLIVHIVNKVVIFSKDYAESKLGSSSILGLYSNPSVKRLDNVLRDDKTQANTLSVHLPSVLKAAKQFEKFDLVLLLNPDSRIKHLDNNLLPNRFRVEKGVNLVLLVELRVLTVLTVTLTLV